MRNDIRFSVVLPVWNAAATAEEAVRSCLEQTEPPHEVLVIDDGSTDGSAARLQALFGDRITLLVLPENQGPSAARNAGLDAATGTHVAFQDADDRWHPRKLELLRQALQAAGNPVLLFHPFTVEPSAWQAAPTVPNRPKRHPFLKLLLSNAIGTPCAVVRREGRLRFDPAMRHMEDYDFFLRTALQSGAWKIDAPLTLLGRPVLSSGGLSANRWAMRRGEFRSWQKLAQTHPLWLPVVPLLWLWGLAKHLYGALRRP